MFGRKKKVEPKRFDARKGFEYGGAAMITLSTIPSVYRMYTKHLETKIMKELSIQNFVEMDDDYDEDED